VVDSDAAGSSGEGEEAALMMQPRRVEHACCLDVGEGPRQRPAARASGSLVSKRRRGRPLERAAAAEPCRGVDGMAARGARAPRPRPAPCCRLELPAAQRLAFPPPASHTCLARSLQLLHLRLLACCSLPSLELASLPALALATSPGKNPPCRRPRASRRTRSCARRPRRVRDPAVASQRRQQLPVLSPD
jgi:hypothetical protein